MEEVETMEEQRAALLATRDALYIRYYLITTFSSEEELASYLKEHPETRDLYLTCIEELPLVRCYLNFVLQRGDNAEDLSNIAFYAFHNDALSLLQAFPADYNFFEGKVSNGISSLIVRNGYMDILDFFVARGLCRNPEVRDNCLCEAVVRGKVDAARLLLTNGADPNHVGRNGHNMVSLAIFTSSLQMLHLLVCHGANLNANPCAVWKGAIMSVGVEIMQFIYDMGCPLPHNIIQIYFDATYRPYNTSYRAGSHSMKKILEVVRLLLSFGAVKPEILDDFSPKRSLTGAKSNIQ